MSIIGLILIIIVLIIIVSVIAFAIRIVPQSKAYVVERIGAYNRTCSVGLHILVPFLDRVANKVSLKEQVVDFAPQPVITKDNVTMQIDTVVYYQITDPRLFTYGVDRPINAIENLTATTLRNLEWRFVGFFDDGVDKGKQLQYGVCLGGMKELNE